MTYEIDANGANYYRIPEEYCTPFKLIDAQNKEILAGLSDPSYVRSTNLDPTLNCAEAYIHAADEVIALFPQGAFPREIARASVESTRALLKRLAVDYPARLIKPVMQAFNRHFRLWYDDVLKRVPPDRYKKELFASERNLLDKIAEFNINMTIYDAERKSTPSPSSELESISITLAAQTKEIKSTKRAVQKLSREKTGKRKENIELQEAAFRYWEAGHNNPAVRQNAESKVTREDVYNYYRRELNALGITSAEHFAKLLKNRIQRLYRTTP